MQLIHEVSNNQLCFCRTMSRGRLQGYLSLNLHSLPVYIFNQRKNISNYMEQSSSWEADSHSANEEITHLLWNPKIHYRVHNSPSIPRGCITFRNKLFCHGGALVNPSPNHQAGESPLVGCPRLLILCIRSYSPYLEAIPSAPWERAMPRWPWTERWVCWEQDCDILETFPQF
jgi:hypothetical protein